MAALKETFSYDIIDKKTGNVFARLRYQDLKNDIQLRISKLNNDELISLIMFNMSFLSKEDLIKYFTNVLNKNIGDNIIIAEDIDIVFNQEIYKKDNLESRSSLPMVFKDSIDNLFDNNTDLKLSNNDFKNSLFGLLKISYQINLKAEQQGMITEDEVTAKKLEKLFILYNDLINLSKARGYNEAKSYIEAIYRGLTYNNFLNSYYKEIKDLYLLLDEKVNRHYLSKPSQSQIEVVSNIRKYLLKLFKTNQFDFSKLSRAYYTGYGTLAEDLFSEIDLIIKSGPCFNDGFDRDFYNSLSRTDKIKYAYNFFLTLYQRGELYLSTNNHRHLIKMLTIVEKLSELQSKEEKTHQRER